jgi:hypothetical protein
LGGVGEKKGIDADTTDNNTGEAIEVTWPERADKKSCVQIYDATSLIIVYILDKREFPLV